MQRSGQPYYSDAKPDPISRAEHLSDATNATLGADVALEHLLAAMRYGPDGIQRHSYAIKSRVKSIDSLVEKVVQKRLEDKPNYRVSDATDIIGVRILCLWPDDLISSSRWLLNFIERMSKPSPPMFSGGSLSSSLLEVIIYHAPTATEQFYESCYKHLRGAFRDRLNIDDKVFYTPVPQDKNYSSVHVVAKIISYVDDQYKIIPVEFQVRTALEDVWAEMDHRLFYKSAIKDPVHFDLARQTMTQQKQHLDAVSVTTDGIHSLRNSLARDPSANAFIRAIGVEVSAERAGLSRAPDRVKSAFQTVEDALGSVYKSLNQKVLHARLEPNLTPEDYGALKTLCERLHELEEVGMGAKNVEKDGLQYFIKMEEALANYWMAQVARQLATSTFDNIASPEELERKLQIDAWTARERHHIAECVSTYHDLAADDAYEMDCFIWFRLGMAELELRNDHVAAKSALTDAVSKLAFDPHIPDRSQFRIVIPRMLGYMLWSQVEGLCRDGQIDQTGRMQNKLLRAFGITYGLERIDVDEGNLRVRGYRDSDERLKALNNWVGYAIYYLDAGGTWEGLEAAASEKGLKFSRPALKAALAELIKRSGDRASSQPWLLHTLTCAYRHLCDKRASKFAQKLSTALDQGLADNEDPAWVNRMRHDIESAMITVGGR